MEFQAINFEKTEGVGKIILNRPDVLNSFNKKMAEELLAAFDFCNNDQEIRAILLTGTGRAFSAGQDLAEATGPQAEALGDIVKKQYNPIISAIRNIEKPVICGVNGIAAGAGANISFACDITYACQSASFIQSFSKIGLIPDSAGTFFLPRLIGMQKALGLTMLAEKISAAKADELGLIYAVLADEGFSESVFMIAKKIASMPTVGLALTKKAVNLSFHQTLDQQLLTELELQTSAGKTSDYREGVLAFLEKRSPVFKGN